MSDVTQNPSVVLDRHHINVPFIIGEQPGTPDQSEDLMTSGLISPPVDPGEALALGLSSGAVMAVGAVVAHGTAGADFMIEPRIDEIDPRDRKKWPKGTAEERDRLEIFLRTGYRGSHTYTIIDAFHDMELDRFYLGHGGIAIIRSGVKDNDTRPAPPIALARFESTGANLTYADKEATMVPTPVALADGRIVWVQVPRFFRRIRHMPITIAFARAVENNDLGIAKSSIGDINQVATSGELMSGATWFKEFGDWRAMDARTGTYAKGYRYEASTDPLVPGRCISGKLPKGAVPAIEVARFVTSFPGAAPYGISAWHAEMGTVQAAREHIKLLLKYLKSGLHAVMLAAATRPFEAASLNAAVTKIDELGRGCDGLGALITVSLIPQSADNPNAFVGNQASADRGGLVLMPLKTELPNQLLDDTLSDTLGARIASAERVPSLLIGRSDGYNFATAAAAWDTANRMRFSPSHREHEGFLDALTAEMGISRWRLRTVSPAWKEDEPLTGVASVAYQAGGMSVNRSMDMLAKVLQIDGVHIDEWWGDLPMPIVSLILTAQDPKAMLDLILPGNKIKIPSTDTVMKPVADMVDKVNGQIAGVNQSTDERDDAV